MGIPLLVKLASFAASLNGNRSAVDSADQTAPAKPRFDPKPPEFVQDSSVTIKGTAEAGSTLKLYRNGSVVKESLVDDSTSFSFSIDITSGENTFWMSATDTAGNTSDLSEKVKVIYDTEAPTVELTTPQDGASFYGSDKNIVVEGTTDPKSKVTINDRVTIVSSSGKFSQKVGLNEGLNAITIKVKDSAGNEIEKKITVSYQP